MWSGRSGAVRGSTLNWQGYKVAAGPVLIRGGRGPCRAPAVPDTSHYPLYATVQTDSYTLYSCPYCAKLLKTESRLNQFENCQNVWLNIVLEYGRTLMIYNFFYMHLYRLNVYVTLYVVTYAIRFCCFIFIRMILCQQTFILPTNDVRFGTVVHVFVCYLSILKTARNR